MKKLFTILLGILIISLPSFAQINWTEHIIAADFNSAVSVYAIDLDGDGDVDVLGAAYWDDDITWWENDGSQNFTEHTIAGNFNGAVSVYAIDLDRDGGVDVLGTAFYDNDITWWENDGSQNFSEHTIARNFDGACSVYAIDLDRDGGVDVLGAARYADDITWWENDGSQNFSEHTIAGNFDGANSVYAIDLDGDGGVDVLGAAYMADDITWWENIDGTGTLWEEHTIAGNFEGASSVYAIDLDSDGDVDVLGAALYADEITWWESDLDPIIPLTITLTPYNPPIVIPANGGSFDFNVEVENTGATPLTFNIWTFATLPNGSQYGPIINVSGFTMNPGISVNRDRTQEVPSNAPAGNYTYDAYVGDYPNLIWSEDHFDFEKLGADGGGWFGDASDWLCTGEPFVGETIVSNIPETYALHSPYPNPFNPSTVLSFELRDASFVKLTVYDVMGRKAALLEDGYLNAGRYEVTFDGSELASGVYFVRLSVEDFQQTRKLLLVK